MTKRAETGFTLLEVLVAFVILALTLSVIMRIFSGGLRNVTLADNYDRALLLAQSRLAELSVVPVEGEAAGDLEGRYHWRSTIHPWIDERNMPPVGVQLRLMEIEVAVAWQGELGGSRQISLRTLQLVPAQVPGS